MHCVRAVRTGTGQHAHYMTINLHNVQWQPTDVDDYYKDSVTAWTSELDSVSDWMYLDASKPYTEWPVAADSFDCLYNCNTIHIAPYAVLEGLVSDRYT
jgi:Protein of unknown function (DUF938)